MTGTAVYYRERALDFGERRLPDAGKMRRSRSRACRKNRWRRSSLDAETSRRHAEPSGRANRALQLRWPAAWRREIGCPTTRTRQPETGSRRRFFDAAERAAYSRARLSRWARRRL